MSDSNDHLLTIVIPTFNRSAGLVKAVTSISDQKVDRVQIHIFDNASTDDTEIKVQDLIQQHPNIRYTRRDHNLGSLANYSNAIQSVTTRYFIPLADDDWLLAGSIRRLLSEIEQHPNLCAVVATTVHQTETGEIVRRNPSFEIWSEGVYEPPKLFSEWVNNGHFEWSSIIFRTEYIKASKVPSTSAGIFWDVDFQMHVFSIYGAKIINQDAAIYVLHAGQDSRAISSERYSGLIRLIERSSTISASTSVIEKFTRKWMNLSSHEAIESNRPKIIFLFICEMLQSSMPFRQKLQFAKTISIHAARFTKKRFRGLLRDD